MNRALTLTLALAFTWTLRASAEAAPDAAVVDGSPDPPDAGQPTETPPARPEVSPPAPPLQKPVVFADRLGPPSATETVVRAAPTPAAQPRADQSASASVVLPDDSPRAYDDLASLLVEIPGVNVVRTGSIGKMSTITLRGANPDQVRIYIDGVPLNIAAGGGVDISTLPVGDVERVEIYRGSSPLEFGESALGGIISITTRTPEAMRAHARSGAGSFGMMFGDVSGGGRLGRLRLYLGLHGLSAQGDYSYLNDNQTPLNTSDDVTGPRPNNDVQQGDGVFRAALSLAGRRTLSLGLVALAREQGLPGLGGAPTLGVRFETMRGLGYLRYESRDDLGGGGRLSAQLYASSQRDRLNDVADETGLGGGSRTRNTTQTVGMNVHAAMPLGEWARPALVAEGRYETYQPVNEAATVPVGVPARRLAGVAGGEIDLRWRWANLDVIPSARLEAMQDVVSRRDAAGIPIENVTPVSRLSPILRLGLVRPLIERQDLRAVAKANVGRYARVPSFIELYGNGTAFVLGNDDLVPERGVNADIGLSVDRIGERVGVQSRTILFGARVDDLIQWRYTSRGQAVAQNLGRAQILGVEQELRLLFGHRARVIAQGTFLDARDKSNNTASNDNQIPYHPRYRAYLRPELVRIPVPGGLEIGAYADVEFRMGSYEDPANLIDMRTRALVGGGVMLAWPRGRLRLTASAANLTGTRMEDAVDWALPGRAVYLALAYAPIGGENDTGPAVFNPRYGP